MEDWREEIYERTNLFAAENGRSLIGQLGYGYDGNVFSTGAYQGAGLFLWFSPQVFSKNPLHTPVDWAVDNENL